MRSHRRNVCGRSGRDSVEKNLAKIDRKALETESSGKLKISLCVNAILVVCVVANVCHGADERQSDDRGLSVETFKPLCILGAGTDGAGKRQ